MANEKGLYLPLSIDLSSWEQSLAAADADLQKAMKEMRASMKDLKMRYDVEIAGAKLAGDDLKVIEIETAKLNGLYTEQKNIVEALNRAYQKSVQEKGESAQASRVLAQQLIRESKEMDRIKNQLQAKAPKIDTYAQERASQAQARLEKELRDVNASAYQKEVNALNDRVQAYIRAGAREVDAHRLYSAEKLKIDQRYAEQARQQQERVTQKQAEETRKQAEEARKKAEEQRRQAQRQAEEQKRQADALAQARSKAREDIVSGALQTVSPRLEGVRRTISGVTGTLDTLGGTAGKVGGLLSKYGGYAVGIGLVAGAFTTLKKQLDKTRESILQASDSTYKLVEHLSDLADTTQLPIDEVVKLSEACKVAGANIDVIAPALNRLDKAVLGGDKTLESFGVNLLDASGNLKSTTEQLEELANAYSNMKALGRGGEFVAELGKNAQALLPFISRLSDADFNNVKELLNSAPKVSKMLEDDAKYIGELDRALEVLNSQLVNAEGAEATQFKIDNVTRSIENAMEKMRAFNETVDSRRFERSGISALDDEMHKFDKSIIGAKSSLNALMSDLTGYLTMRVAYGLDSIRNNSFEDFDDYQVRKSLEYQEKLNKRDNDRIQAQLQSIQKPQTAEDANKRIRDMIDRNYANADEEMRLKLYTKLVEEEAKKRETARQREAEMAEKSTAELKKQLRDLTATEEERKVNAINDRYEKNAEKDVTLAEKIRQAELKKLSEETTKKRIALEQKLTDVTLTEQEKRIAAINKEYEANAKIDNVLADKIKNAELKRVEEETTKARLDAMDKIRSVMQSDFDTRMQQIEKEKQAWIKAGADRVSVEQATQKQITELYKQQAQARMSEAEKLLTEQKQVIKDIQKGLSDSEIMERANKRWMKSRGINQSMIDTLQSVGFDRVNYLADARQRLLGRFGNIQIPQQTQEMIGYQIGQQPQLPQAPQQSMQAPQVTVNLTFDGTVVEDMSSMQKIADKVSEVITPAIEKALRGESAYGY